mmetsp:Transcript_3362/g.6824  ORF Transcript_3362/g.6824 Transcript_3362/m.6824 type:complete len:315 (-) Transcript_3362:36-980(-)
MSSFAAAPQASESYSAAAPLFPPNDKNSPSFHFWTFIIRDGDVGAAMRNGGKWVTTSPTPKCNISLIKPRDPNADPMRPSKAGYEYDNGEEGQDGAKYGTWVLLSDECRKRLLDGYTNASELDAKTAKMKADGLKLKNVACTESDPNMAGKSFGGAEIQLPIGIDEYRYFNYVQNRMPLGLEKGFQITVSKKGDEEWTGKVPHLLGQEFVWRKDTEDCVKVTFDLKDWKTWENNVEGVPGVVFEGDKVEIPTTHLWVDFDKYEMVWFWNKKAIARKVMLIPFFLKKPVDWAIGYGLKRLKKGEGYVEGEDEGES